MDPYSDEYKKYDSDELLKSRNSTFAMLLVFLFFTLLFFGGFAAFAYALIACELPGEMAIVIIMCLGGGIFFAYAAMSYFRTLKCIITEAKSREIAEEDARQANYFIIKRIILVVILIIIAAIVAWSVFGKGSSVRCRECGSKGVYSKYGYCYSCYQDVYNNIKENN